jgi:hypothetical protein
MFYFKTEPSSGDHSQEEVALSKEKREGGLLTSFARATRGLRRPSLDARSRRPNRPPSCGEK